MLTKPAHRDGWWLCTAAYYLDAVMTLLSTGAAGTPAAKAGSSVPSWVHLKGGVCVLFLNTKASDSLSTD